MSSTHIRTSKTKTSNPSSLAPNPQSISHFFHAKYSIWDTMGPLTKCPCCSSSHTAPTSSPKVLILNTALPQSFILEEVLEKFNRRMQEEDTALFYWCGTGDGGTGNFLFCIHVCMRVWVRSILRGIVGFKWIRQYNFSRKTGKVMSPHFPTLISVIFFCVHVWEREREVMKLFTGRDQRRTMLKFHNHISCYGVGLVG